MARPRIFISSTFYDLRHIRTDIERFIKDLGYDPILNERGHIPYGKDEKLEEYCYREIATCDILVSIIGSRFGSSSQHSPHSISQVELKTALEQGKQVYIFIEKNVYGEYHTYLANKDNKSVKYRFADNISIFEFINYCEALPNNNTINSFESTGEIVTILREQWAGLFQRYLHDNERVKELQTFKNIEATAQTLKELVGLLAKENKGSSETVEAILLSNHPIFPQLRKTLKVKYRVFFTNRSELNEWLFARNFVALGSDLWESPEFEEWTRAGDGVYDLLKIKKTVFKDDGTLRLVTADQWSDSNILLERNESAPATDDDIPF